MRLKLLKYWAMLIRQKLVSYYELFPVHLSFSHSSPNRCSSVTSQKGRGRGPFARTIYLQATEYISLPIQNQRFSIAQWIPYKITCIYINVYFNSYYILKLCSCHQKAETGLCYFPLTIILSVKSIGNTNFTVKITDYMKWKWSV